MLLPASMRFDALLYTYKEVGIVEKNGVKYKKLVKVPRLRSKHREALAKAVFFAVLVAGAFKVVGWVMERSPRPAEDRPPSQFQGF